MNTYTITEKSDFAATRMGYKIAAKNLSAAKACASREQTFKNTVMEIEQNGQVVARKNNKGVWSES